MHTEPSPYLRLRPPTHPGATLREDILPATGMTITQVAERLRVSRQQLHRVLAEESAVSMEMALRLGKFFGNGPDLWLGMQGAFDLWQTRARLEAQLEQIPCYREGPAGDEA